MARTWLTFSLLSCEKAPQMIFYLPMGAKGRMSSNKSIVIGLNRPEEGSRKESYKPNKGTKAMAIGYSAINTRQRRWRRRRYFCPLNQSSKVGGEFSQFSLVSTCCSNSRWSGELTKKKPSSSRWHHAISDQLRLRGDIRNRKDKVNLESPALRSERAWRTDV